MAGVEDLTIDAVAQAVEGFALSPHKTTFIVNLTPGQVTPTDLPLQPMNAHGQAFKHIVDLVESHEALTPDQLEELRPMLSDKNWQGLPHPLRCKEAPPEGTLMQIAIVPHPAQNGRVCIVKHLTFPDKLKHAYVSRLIQGQAHAISWAHPKTGMKVWQYMLENMGCFQARQWSLVPASAKGKLSGNILSSMDLEEIDKGFDFIEEHGPRTTAGLAQVRWVTKNVHDKESPIFSWPVALVEKALRCLTTDGVLAVKQFDWPLTLKDVDTEILSKVLFHIAPALTSKGLMLIGLPGAGKTPLGRTIAMAMARHMQKVNNLEGRPGFRTTSDLDFMRGEKGHVLVPDLFDDGDLNSQPMRKVKAFLDVGEEETMSKERWGAAKWVKGQCRILMDNNFRQSAEPPHDREWVSHVDFFGLVSEAFPPGAGAAHYMAIMKRACIMLNTSGWLYWRMADEKEVDVPRIKLSAALDYLKPEAKPKYGKYIGGDKTEPDNMEEDITWESQWLQHAMEISKGGAASQHPLPWSIIRKAEHQHFGFPRMAAIPTLTVGSAAASSRDSIPGGASLGAGGVAGSAQGQGQLVQVKRELSTNVWAHLTARAQGSAVIDLTESPPKHMRTSSSAPEPVATGALAVGGEGMHNKEDEEKAEEEVEEENPFGFDADMSEA